MDIHIMRFIDAVDDCKRHQNSSTEFPGERRTTTGRFSGHCGRLVHVESDGSIRDFSYPLIGLTGITRSRFGLRPDNAGENVTWFNGSNATQHYLAGTSLVVTEHETEHGRIQQYDLTLDDQHITHFDSENESVEIVVNMEMSPEGRSTRVGQLHHEDAVEIHHSEEVDYIASDPGFETLRGIPFGGFEATSKNTATSRSRSGSERHSSEAQLSGDFIGVVPSTGEATLVTLLTTRTAASRATALKTVREAARGHDQTSLTKAAEREVEPVVDHELPHTTAIAADFRVLSLLSGDTGLRIAGPDFDPYYAHSGGYGYSWFRDDAEISRFLFDVDQQLELGLDQWHSRSVAVYEQTQLEDGTWPHRVWPFDATLAPGWANARLESGSDVSYQADQTGSVAAFLATSGGDSDTLRQALDGLDVSLAEDGRPVTCQNAWENMSGRFTHTVATFLEAYSTLAATTGGDMKTRAMERAKSTYSALDDLWVDERGVYALREYGDHHDRAGVLDARADSATFALASAHRSYAQVGELSDCRVDRLVSHITTVIETLTRETSAVRGLIRFEEDDWRKRDQEHEKIWTVATVWGAYGAAELAVLLNERGGDGRATQIASTAHELLSLVLPDGPLCLDNGFLPEQMFDDGTPDSATPLGWSHALRLATITLMNERDLFDLELTAELEGNSGQV